MPTWKAQKERSAVTCISCRAVQQHGNLQLSVLSATLWRWETLLHTNCARSPGTELRMVTITPTLHFNHAVILLRALKLPAIHRKQQEEWDDRGLHNNDTHTHPLSFFSHVSHHLSAMKNMWRVCFFISFLHNLSYLVCLVLCEVRRYKCAAASLFLYLYVL